MIEDYLTGHHFFRRRLEEIMTVLLKPEQGPESLSVAGACAMLAARTPSIETDGR